MTTIERRKLGRSTLVVPGICVGTDSWGERLFGYGKRYGKEEVYEAYRACLDNGLNFFDTAPSYAKGESEKLIGEFRKCDGRAITIATKFENPLYMPWARRPRR